jgi:hypothetical protein
MRRIAGVVIFVVILISLNYSYALTPEQIIRLKQAGVEDKTIQMMIRQEMDAKEKENAADLPGVREVKDGEGNSVVVYSTGKPGGGEACDTEREKADKAWKMLQNMIIDNRK